MSTPVSALCYSAFDILADVSALLRGLVDKKLLEL